MMTCINVAEFALISCLEKDHSMIETRHLKNVEMTVTFGPSHNICTNPSKLNALDKWEQLYYIYY